MPRKVPAIPVYEIPTAGGTLRVKLSENRLTVLMRDDETDSLIELNANGWRALMDLRDILMPKRARKAKQ